MFLLPVKGGSGGAHSVMQEGEAMWALGQPTVVAVNAGNAENLSTVYADLPRIRDHIHGYNGVAGLKALIRELEPRVVIATTNKSVHTLAEVAKDFPGMRTAYYVQDYEPFFYEGDSDDWRMAYASYGLIPHMLHFAKTRWLQEVVQLNHEVSVVKVEPSIDHIVYYPNVAEVLADVEPLRTLRVVTMLRPATPRRAPHRTVRILNQLAQTYGARAELIVFGCQPGEIADNSLELDPRIVLHGVLSREQVGDLMRTADLFMDLSDFQAFGRTAIEAMSCGAMAIVPAHGGVYEYGIDGQNCFIVDTRQDEMILKAAQTVFAMSHEDRIRMRLKAITKGFEYTVEKAALSELNALI